MAKVVFITGATGFIGSRVVRLLSARGDRVQCLVRDRAKAGELAQLGVGLVQGDVCDVDALDRGLNEADAALHLAGIYDLGTIDEAEMERVNVQGTREFIAATHRAGTPVRIHVSTTSALEPPTTGIADESAALLSPPYPSTYHRTKTEAHRLALHAQESGDALVIVCPSFVYGPGDEGPAGRLVRDLVRGRLPGLLTDPAQQSFAYIDDVAEGMVGAIDRGRPGETYILAGEHASVSDFAKEIARAAGRRPPLLRFPVGVAAATGGVLDAISRVVGVRFTMTREGVTAVASRRWLFSWKKAEKELGYTSRPLADGVAETVATLLPRKK